MIKMYYIPNMFTNANTYIHEYKKYRSIYTYYEIGTAPVQTEGN